MADLLLPPNAGARELAVEQVGTERYPLDADIVRRFKDPWTCPAHLLPWLAYEHSVDLWDDEWPEERKRSIIANARAMHRAKGTKRGLEWYLSYADTDVIRVLTPPLFAFCGPSLTREEREVWLRTLPQVRIFRAREGGTGAGVLYSGGPTWPVFRETTFSFPNDALARTARRARYVVDGAETDARIEQEGTAYRIALRGRNPGAVYTSRYMGTRFFVPSSAQLRMFAIAPTASAPWRSAVSPSFEPVTSEPELVAQQGQAGGMAFSGRGMTTGFFVPSTAGFRLFERFALIDRTRIGPRTPAISFMSISRFGIAPHTAEVKVRIRGRRSRFAAGDRIVIPGARFWFPRDAEALEAAARAARASKRLSDRIYLDTRTQPEFIAGLPFLAGRDRFVV